MNGGARCVEACRIMGICKRTFLRWRANRAGEDRRAGPHRRPANALREWEREMIVAIANNKHFRELSPAEIVPKLADAGVYIASESTFYRILRRERMIEHRRASKPARHSYPEEKKATGPNQVWSWDITYLKSPIRGRFYYLYMIVDVWSRKIVGWAVHGNESEEHARRLVLEACNRESVNPQNLVLHSDNGGPMKGATFQAKLQSLGIIPSFSRPRVCDDNPYSEALFRTLKYVPEYPSLPFKSREAADNWIDWFVQWYNREHLHSGIQFVTPATRHEERDKEILENRKEVYKKARDAHPERWSGETRNWDRVETVILNPKKRTSNNKELKKSA
mgnify:FL=1